MKVGHNTFHYMECIARSNHDLRIGMQRGQTVTIEIVKYLSQ